MAVSAPCVFDVSANHSIVADEPTAVSHVPDADRLIDDTGAANDVSLTVTRPVINAPVALMMLRLLVFRMSIGPGLPGVPVDVCTEPLTVTPKIVWSVSLMLPIAASLSHAALSMQVKPPPAITPAICNVALAGAAKATAASAVLASIKPRIECSFMVDASTMLMHSGRMDKFITMPLRISIMLAERIDDFWHEHRFKSRAEAVRVLLERGLRSDDRKSLARSSRTAQGEARA
jgi:hypothetical protein